MLALILACTSPDSDVQHPERMDRLVGEERPEGLDSQQQLEEEDSDPVEQVDTSPPEPTLAWVCYEEIRNGSEICDDASFGVPDPYVPLAIKCVTGEGGVGYVSANTGPTMSDGIARCQGWEENGDNAWDHLDYLDQIVCTATDQIHEIDLSSRAGANLWVGVHDLPAGGGHFTHVCIAHWE
ncbi:MAG TPA: hypothetical protein QGF58_30300 [Myxococcota bacterium]|nr:hypothetical protein [Myxococcota bacterium]